VYSDQSRGASAEIQAEVQEDSGQRMECQTFRNSHREQPESAIGYSVLVAPPIMTMHVRMLLMGKITESGWQYTEV
jgi:hypothetical protein